MKKQLKKDVGINQDIELCLCSLYQNYLKPLEADRKNKYAFLNKLTRMNISGQEINEI